MITRETVYRHRLPTRLWHWLNVLALLVLLMSGLQIFNAHPALYWGQSGSNLDTPVMEIGTSGAGKNLIGIIEINGREFDTTGFLGLSKGSSGEMRQIAFPAWATLPGFRDLATARHWHFFFAWAFAFNMLMYIGFSLFNGHLRRDLAPSKGELSPRHILHDIWQHIRLRFPKGEAAKRYNILQKLAYLSVILLALPLMILTGLTMSPGFNAIAPWLLDVFGGRQSARTLHFILANFLVLFVIVHLIMLLLAGVWNEMRSMFTGNYIIKHETGDIA
jgi:thiosulfate reductase cytochrome b subunit